MKRIDFYKLTEALQFVLQNGGPSNDIEHPYSIYEPKGQEYKLVELRSGNFFGIEAQTKGPYSEVTPDVDTEVHVFGLIKET